MENNDHHQSDGDGRLDNLFREGLKDFHSEPSRHIWKGISRKLLMRELIRFNFANFSRSLWIGGAAVIIITGTLLVITLPGKKEPSTGSKINPSAPPEINLNQATKNNPQHADSLPEQHKAITKTGHPVDAGTQTSQPLAAAVPKAIIRPVKEPSKKITGSETTDVRAVNESQTKPVIYEQKDTHTQSTITNSSEPSGASFTSSERNEILISRITNPSLTIVNEPGPTVIPPVEPNPYPEEIITRAPLPSFYSLAIGVMPELSFYKTSSSYAKFDYWVGLEFAYHLGRFYFKPGVSYGFVNDNGNYIVSYKRLDSIGFYYHVNSYTIDPHDPTKIIFNYTTSAIMDSINHVGNEKASNRYQYFQVPMLLGFNLVETPRIRLAMQAGPGVSLLVSHKETHIEYIQLSNSTVTERVNQTPARITVSWQAWAGLHFEYRFRKMLSFIVEPTFKYYLKPVSVQTETLNPASPWVIGINLGLQYNFGFKNYNK